VIEGIHLEYLQAGSNMLETNTFNGTGISQADYELPGEGHGLHFALKIRHKCSVDGLDCLRASHAVFCEGTHLSETGGNTGAGAPRS